MMETSRWLILFMYFTRREKPSVCLASRRLVYFGLFTFSFFLIRGSFSLYVEIKSYLLIQICRCKTIGLFNRMIEFFCRVGCYERKRCGSFVRPANMSLSSLKKEKDMGRYIKRGSRSTYLLPT